MNYHKKQAMDEETEQAPQDFISCEEINKIARLENILPLRKTKDLEINQLYKVTEFKIVNTEYGQSVMALLDNECWIFLPKRLSVEFLRDKKKFEGFQNIAELGCLELCYLGGRYNLCEFQINKDNTSN